MSCPIDEYREKDKQHYNAGIDCPKINTDCRPLMLQLAKMANVEHSLVRRMVLVLDVDDVPRLYLENFIGHPEEELANTGTGSLVVEQKAVVVNTTTMQNKSFETFAPVKRDE